MGVSSVAISALNSPSVILIVACSFILSRLMLGQYIIFPVRNDVPHSSCTELKGKYFPVDLSIRNRNPTIFSFSFLIGMINPVSPYCFDVHLPLSDRL